MKTTILYILILILMSVTVNPAQAIDFKWTHSGAERFELHCGDKPGTVKTDYTEHITIADGTVRVYSKTFSYDPVFCRMSAFSTDNREAPLSDECTNAPFSAVTGFSCAGN